MKITVKKGDFEKTLSEVVGIVKKKATIQLIQMAKLEVIGKDKNIVAITGTDLETIIVSTIVLDEVIEPAEFCFDIHTLLGLLKSLPEQPIDLIYTSRVKIKTSTGIYDIDTMDSQDFPKLPEINEENSIILENKYLERIVHSATGAASDELRPIMCGVYVCLKNKMLNIVATDAHVMMVSDYEFDSENEFDCIIPAGGIGSIKSILGKYPDVNFYVDNKFIMIKRGTSKVITRRVEGQYVNYRVVIGKKEDAVSTVKIKIEDIIKPMKRITFVSQNELIKMKVSGMFIDLLSANKDTGIEANETIGAETSGEIEIGINYDKFSQITNIVNSGDLTIYMTTEQRALLLYPDADKNFMMLVMPVMINGN